MPKLSFKVNSVNAGPAPFDVIGSDDDGNELRMRFQEENPQVEPGTIITVTYTATKPAEE